MSVMKKVEELIPAKVTLGREWSGFSLYETMECELNFFVQNNTPKFLEMY